MLSISARRLLVISLVLLTLLQHVSAQQIRRRRPHYPKFEILWPLHWVSAAYVWGFLKLGLVFAGLMLLLAFRAFSSWKSEPVFVDHGAPVYHFRATESRSIDDDVLYWKYKIDKLAASFNGD